MSKQLSVGNKENIMATKMEYDSLNQAIRLAKVNGASDKDIKTLILLKEDARAKRVDNDNKLLKSMTLATNVVPIGGSWYAIRFTNEKNDLSISMEILNVDDVAILQRDCRSDRELSQKDLNVLVPGCIDEVSLELYKQQVFNRASDYVYDYCGIETSMVKEEVVEVVRPLTVSSHAGMRYVQRKLRIGMSNETVAEDYRRSHLKEVEAGVLEGYSKAELVWVAEDGIEFSFDEDNIMYVKGNNNGTNNIVTLYEEEFGFTKEINRMITLQQLQVLALARESLLDTEREQEELMKHTDDDIRAIADNITLLQSQIDLLSAQRATLTTSKDQHTKAIRVAKNKYSVEFNKLFTKWNEKN